MRDLVFGLTVWRCGFAGLVLWYLTSEPFTAVAIMSTIHVLGNGPTVGNILRDPFSESPAFFASSGLRTTLAIAALETYSATTLLFPAAVGTSSVMVAILILARRRIAATA